MGQRGTCKIGNWCVCQWAFSRYLARAGGCDSIVDLVCDATNMAAFRAYSKSNQPEHKAALECIKKKCGFVDGKPAAVTQGIEPTPVFAADKVGEQDAVTNVTNATCDGNGSSSGTCNWLQL